MFKLLGSLDALTGSPFPSPSPNPPFLVSLRILETGPHPSALALLSIGFDTKVFSLSYILSPFKNAFVLSGVLLLSCQGWIQVGDLPASASHRAGLTGVPHHTCPRCLSVSGRMMHKTRSEFAIINPKLKVQFCRRLASCLILEQPLHFFQSLISSFKKDQNFSCGIAIRL